MWDVPGAGEPAGAGPGRAGRRARRLHQVRRPDARDEEPQAADKPVSNPAPSLEQVMQIRVGTTVSQPRPHLDPVDPAGGARPT